MRAFEGLNRTFLESPGPEPPQRGWCEHSRPLKSRADALHPGPGPGPSSARMRYLGAELAESPTCPHLPFPLVFATSPHVRTPKSSCTPDEHHRIMDHPDPKPKLETTPSPYPESPEEEKLVLVTEVVVDPEGDLSLLVGAELPGAEPLIFQVCSAALRRASPVWKAMLSGPWVHT